MKQPQLESIKSLYTGNEKKRKEMKKENETKNKQTKGRQMMKSKALASFSFDKGEAQQKQQPLRLR